MVTIFCGTNRPNSRSRIVSDAIKPLAEKYYTGVTQLLDLIDISPSELDNDYDAEKLSDRMKGIQDQYVVDASHWIIVVPEYNGAFAGYFKFFIDAISVRRYDESFKGKKVLLVGVSAGKAGNLRGLDHLTNQLNYLGLHVHPKKMPISSISSLLDDDNNLDQSVVDDLDGLVKSFLA